MICKCTHGLVWENINKTFNITEAIAEGVNKPVIICKCTHGLAWENINKNFNMQKNCKKFENTYNIYKKK